MTNYFKNSAVTTIYLLVFAGGISIFLMLFTEYHEANKLIENNKVLMKSTVLKTLTNNVSSKLITNPLTISDIENNWQQLPLNFLASDGNHWIFPKRFQGVNSNDISSLWSLYNLSPNSQTHIEDAKTSNKPVKTTPKFIPKESDQRIKSLNKIKQALKAGDQTKVINLIESYFLLVENFQLSAIEEIISSLSFLLLEKNSRWNSQLIELIIFNGSHQVTPLIEYIFNQNNKLTRADLKRSIDYITQILESANIDSTWFNEATDALWKENPQINIDTLANNLIIHNSWISMNASDELMLLLPFKISTELKLVEEKLKSQGIFDQTDSISITSNNLNDTNILLSNLSFDIHRHSWEKRISQQEYFFIIKITLTVVFIASLFALIIFITYKNKKKTEFIKLKESFINLVSHELKTPLASIRLMIETLQKRHDKKLSLKNYPGKIIGEVDRLWLMVDNLLSLNQIKSGELKLNIDKVNVNSVLCRVCNSFNYNQPKKLNFKKNLNNIYINFDPLLFELVITNLFSNSIKYCDNAEVSIEISYSQEKSTLYLSDNACGINKSDWHRVFDDFYRSANNTKQGSGVGLSLCRQIMNIHKGSISIVNSDTTGTKWALQFNTLKTHNQQ